MENKLLIESVKSFYGFTTKEAKNYVKTITEKRKQFLIEGYKQNIIKSFYND